MKDVIIDIPKLIISGGLFFIVLILVFSSLYTIRSGEIGVISTFQELQDTSMGAGIHAKIPLVQQIHRVNVQTQNVEEVMDVPSKEGLVFNLDVSIIYNIKPDQVPLILKTVNGDIKDTLLIPYMRSEVRDIVSGKEAKEIYSDSGRGEVESKLKTNLQAKLGDKIIITDALLRKVTLPETVKNSVESKIATEQQAQQKEFELQKAKKDAEIDVARAEGIAKSNQIIAGSITPDYLRWKFIDALAQAKPNVIYVPTETNLPIMEASRYIVNNS